MSKFIHLNINIAGCMRNNKDLSGIISEKNGRSLSHSEVVDLFISELNQGYEVWCGCDNRDKRGACAGHPVEAE